MADAPSLRILVANDQPVVVRAFTRVLQRLGGHRVVGAGDGAEALEVLAREPVDLLITRDTMPGMDGWELLRQVKCRHPALPAFLVTTIGWPDRDAELIRLGYPPAVLAPLSSEELLGYVERATFR